jgi:hypothetical protein
LAILFLGVFAQQKLHPKAFAAAASLPPKAKGVLDGKKQTRRDGNSYQDRLPEYLAEYAADTFLFCRGGNSGIFHCDLFVLDRRDDQEY